MEKIAVAVQRALEAETQGQDLFGPVPKPSVPDHAFGERPPGESRTPAPGVSRLRRKCLNATA